MKCGKGEHHYTESGLENVYISGIEICTCSCGEKIVSVPRVSALHDLIGIRIVKKNASLSGREIRFLRKNIGLTGTKLAEIIGVDNATISRWEKGGQFPEPPNDRLLRLVYCGIKGIPDKQMIEKEFAGIAPKQNDIPPYVVPAREWSDLDSCSVNEE